MAHFAKIIDNKVVKVLVVEEAFLLENKDRLPGEWIQTSYNTRGGVHYNPNTGEPDGGTPLRKNYAGIGYTYDRERDAFIPPKPFNSWVLDENTCWWNPPIPYPEDGKAYKWDEATVSWIEVQKES